MALNLNKVASPDGEALKPLKAGAGSPDQRSGADMEQAAEQAGFALSALAAALEREAERTAAERRAGPAEASPALPEPGFSFRPVKTMREAAAAAEECCSAWRIDGDTGGTRLGPPELLYACEQQDLRVTFDPSEEGKYYLVKPDGSIGVTLDGCRSIDWIFLPA